MSALVQVYLGQTPTLTSSFSYLYMMRCPGCDTRCARDACSMFLSQYLITSWTNDIGKQKYMNDWLNHIVKKKPVQSKKFQRGVELCKISSEVRSGYEG